MKQYAVTLFPLVGQSCPCCEKRFERETMIQKQFDNESEATNYFKLVDSLQDNLIKEEKVDISVGKYDSALKLYDTIFKNNQL